MCHAAADAIRAADTLGEERIESVVGSLISFFMVARLTGDMDRRDGQEKG